MTEQAGREMTLEEWVVRLPPDHKARSELATLVAEVAGMRDKWTPPDEVAELQAENAALKRENEMFREVGTKVILEWNKWGVRGPNKLYIGALEQFAGVILAAEEQEDG